jgi:ribosomal protein L29
MSIKNKDIHGMSKEEIVSRLNELKKELIKLNAQRAVGTVSKNPLQINQIRKTVAKLTAELSKKEVPNK